MVKFDWKNFINGKLAISMITKEELENFAKFLESDKVKILEFLKKWERYKELTCVMVDKNNRITIGTITDCYNAGCKNCTTFPYKNKYDFLPNDVEQVIFNKQNTTVILINGHKGVSKCSNEDTFDTYSGFVNAYYRAKNDHIFDLKNVLNNCVKSANKKGYKQAILKNYK